MKDFINLDEQDILHPNHPHSLPNIKLNTKIVDGIINDEEVEGICADYEVITINKVGVTEEDNTDQICVKDDCDASKYYGCTNDNNVFQKDNLFSELTDEYQRTIARINLGIADAYALKWGNIKGNLSNQKDLYTFVTETILYDINNVIEEINLKLAQWACEIETRLKYKADLFSPEFLGIPTTSLPLLTDNSDRIASTEWVTAKLSELDDTNIKFISLNPESAYYSNDPINVTVTWEYYNDIDKQSLNGIVLENNIREYTFTNVNTSKVITLNYTYGETEASKSITFNINYPIFYGVSPDYTKNNKTINSTFTVNAKEDEYIYVMIPNGRNTSLGVNSISGGFILLGGLELFNNMYYVFKSYNSGLGETSVEILSSNGFQPEDMASIRELLDTKADKIEIDRLSARLMRLEQIINNL